MTIFNLSILKGMKISIYPHLLLRKLKKKKGNQCTRLFVIIFENEDGGKLKLLYFWKISWRFLFYIEYRVDSR